MRRLVPLIWAGAWRACNIVSREAPATPAAVVFRNCRRAESGPSYVAAGGFIDNLLWERVDGHESGENEANAKPRRSYCQAGGAGAVGWRHGAASPYAPWAMRLICASAHRIASLGLAPLVTTPANMVR